MTRTALLLASFPALVLGFSNTVPVVGWSSHRSTALDSFDLGTAQPHAHAIVEAVTGHPAICEHDAVILVDQPGLHASDLRNLSPSSPLTRLITSSLSSRQFPYARKSSHVDLTTTANEIVTHCGSRLVSSAPINGDALVHAGKKHVIVVDMPSLETIEFDRHAMVEDAGRLLSSHVEKIAATLPNHIVILISSVAPSLVSRQEHTDTLHSLLAKNGTNVEDGGILKRYQILTPGLIISLLAAFFVVLPVVMLAIKALASIQSPVRLDAPKGFNAQERKNQ